MFGRWQGLRQHSSWVAVVLLASAALGYIHARPQWRELKVVQHDVKHLYAYVPAAFIYHDLSFAFARRPPPGVGPFLGLIDAKNGAQVPKTVGGTAVLYTPFFLVAHAAAKIFGIEANGYSWIYHYFIAFGAVTYAALGLFILRGVLVASFAEDVVGLTLIALFAGTNLFYYTAVESGMTHVHSFFLFALFVHLTIKWHARPRWRLALGLGATLGLITLVRPTSAVVVLVFLFYRPGALGPWRSKLALMRRNALPLFAALLVAFAVVIPQLVFWKLNTGQWLFQSYGNEGFFFSRPHIVDGLFSYRKGLLVYSPLMSLALAGIVLLWRRQREWFWAVAAFTAVNLYVVFSWWCWWYGGSYGMRALIESYAIWALPMAATIERLWSGGPLRRHLTVGVIGILVCLNLFQIEQYRRAIIHWDSMTRQAYWTVFLSRRWPAHYETLLQTPDYDRAVRGEDEYGDHSGRNSDPAVTVQ